jgi:hypothetical protein
MVCDLCLEEDGLGLTWVTNSKDGRRILCHDCIRKLFPVEKQPDDPAESTAS